MTRRTALAAGIALAAQAAAAAPAWALQWTLPASYHKLSLKAPDGSTRELTGLQVPVIWLGGPLGPLALHFAGGYAWQRDLRTQLGLNFVTLQSDLDLEVPLGPLVPYVGIEGMAWFPINSVPFLRGIPLMAGPHAGLRFSLADLLSFDLGVFGYPYGPNLWNTTNEAGKPYTGRSWAAGGKFSISM